MVTRYYYDTIPVGQDNHLPIQNLRLLLLRSQPGPSVVQLLINDIRALSHYFWVIPSCTAFRRDFSKVGGHILAGDVRLVHLRSEAVQLLVIVIWSANQ